MSFYDRKEVRDILAYLKLLANPADEVSLLRIINVPARGISQTTVKRLLEEAIQRGKPLWEILPHAGQLAGLPAAAVAGGRAVSRDDRAVSPARGEEKQLAGLEVVKTLIREVAYKDELTRQYPDADDQESRWAAVEEVVNAVAGYAQRASEADAWPASCKRSP